MLWTNYHAKYFAYELTQRFASKVATEGFDDADNLDKITASLSDAQVDLNPHQVDAALFALRSPLSQGVVLADEVGLGKTIEAGIVISQRWAERKRRILIIAPANLRKQWSQELADKFFLPSVILEKKSFDDCVKKGNFNPFNQDNTILICSFQFIRSKEAYVSRTEWDLVIIDEAHRLRNVYRKDNKIGNAIKDALQNKPKILLTATPLQNSLMELYGLVSLVDDYIFGDQKSFKQQYAKITNDAQFEELKNRIAPICKRTLRAQVREYIRYTERLCITHVFTPADDEHELYMKVSDYLRKPQLYALPNSQRSLMTLILRKLLASSTFAIAETLRGLTEKLQMLLEKQEELQNTEGGEQWEQDFETSQEIKDEWNDDPDFDNENNGDTKRYTQQELEEIWIELEEVRGFHVLAQSIQQNSKGDNLVAALNSGFQKMRELGAAEKAVIFTESVRTQSYIRDILVQSGYKGKIVLFNGSNNDPDSTRIYQKWLQKNKDSDRISGSRAADIRAALTEHFRDEAAILIATEAAAEGINLQFCSLVVNYDLPWNPQRIEQRIGRCHRYGQKFDVVVVNFKNSRNAADIRVYELLEEKFKLFNGVFGASDEVLGSIEGGVDFEKRIAKIYQNCRSEAEINAAFDALRAELETPITERLEQTHQQLLANFDEDVLNKIKLESLKKLSAFEAKFWQFTRFVLAVYADFTNDYTFVLKRTPLEALKIPLGQYQFLPYNVPSEQLPTHAQLYRFGHPLAQYLLEQFKTTPSVLSGHVVFDCSNAQPKINILESLIGETGCLMAQHYRIESLETEDFLLLSGLTTEGGVLDDEQCRRLFSLAGTESKSLFDIPMDMHEVLKSNIVQQADLALKGSLERNAQILNGEAQKLEQWAEDKIFAAESEIKEAKKRINELKRALQKAASPNETLQIQKDLQETTRRQTNLRRQIFEVEDEVYKLRDALIEKLKSQNHHRTESNNLFSITWEIV